jgi:hypothetical protein
MESGVKPGKHTLELRVVASDHNTELDGLERPARHYLKNT